MSAQLNSTQIAQILAQVNQAGIDLSNPQAITDFASSLTEVKPKATRVYKLPTDSNRCVARVWSTGSGLDQCSKPRNTKVDGCEYCIIHHKEALESTVPCQFSEDGNRKVGLFMGRIDEPIPYKNELGEIVIIWNTPEMKAIVADELKNGASYCKFIKEAGFKRVPVVHRVRKSTKPAAEPKAPSQPKTKAAKKGSRKSNPDMPKKAQNAYMFYIAAKRDELKAQLLADFILANPNSTPDEQKKSNSIARVAQLAGSNWKSLSDSDKAPWKALEEADKARYTLEMEAYKSNSTSTEQTTESSPQSSTQLSTESSNEQPEQQLECEEIDINGITYLYDPSTGQLFTQDCEPCGFYKDGQISSN